MSISMPKDSSGRVIARAMGVPILVENKVLGSTNWVDIVNLEDYPNRVFIGLALINPDSTVKVYLSFSNPGETDEASVVALEAANITMDLLTYGVAVDDVTRGDKCTRIRAKLDGNVGTPASATITYAGNPTDGQTITIGTQVYEFVDDASTSNNSYVGVAIGGSADTTWQTFVTAVNETDQAVTLTINTGTNVITVTSNYGGTSGDGYVVADGTTGATVSGNLAGGIGTGVTPILMIW